MSAAHFSRARASAVVLILLFFCATLQFVRFYVTETTFYLNLPVYLAGHERLPFQERILPAVLIALFNRSPLARLALSHDHGSFTPHNAPLFLISLIAVVVAGIFTQRLYRCISNTRSLSFFVYPVFLFALMWTYSIHLEANFSYPYDMLAVMFFSAGLYYIYRRNFWPLLAIVAVGTFNRETTLFLLPIYLLDASVDPDAGHPLLTKRLRDTLFRLPWLRVVALFCVWVAIRTFLMHRFAHNDRSEDYVRLKENFAMVRPRLFPALLNICGYLLPLVLFFRTRVHSLRYRRYLWVLPLWFAIMFYTGVIVETRIFGELCPYVAVAVVLIAEEHITRLSMEGRLSSGGKFLTGAPL